jgi:hypothetical protein
MEQEHAFTSVLTALVLHTPALKILQVLLMQLLQTQRQSPVNSVEPVLLIQLLQDSYMQQQQALHLQQMV